MKRVLMLASVASMIDQFNMSNIALLQKMGYHVDVACNFKEGNTCSEARVQELKKKLKDMEVRCYQVDFARNITHMAQNLKAYRQVVDLMKTNHYTFCHCHSPIGGVVARIAGHMTKTKIIYTAHGFHFYKGAPVKNWLLYYPVEWLLSWWTDALITINHEDYERAAKKLHAKQTYYVPGVGVDLAKFHPVTAEEKEQKREEFGFTGEDIILLSVGELSERKNHAVVIEALRMLAPEYPNLKYLICGQGEKKEYLQKLIRAYDLTERVILLGFRVDVAELYHVADIFVFPSRQEGLPVALMEAMASGLPVICSEIRGNTELVKNGKGGYLVKQENPKEFDLAFRKLNQMRLHDSQQSNKMSQENVQKMNEYCETKIKKKMQDIYSNYETEGVLF